MGYRLVAYPDHADLTRPASLIATTPVAYRRRDKW